LKCEDRDEEERKIDGAGASGGGFEGGFYEAAGLVGEQAGAGVARAGDADWRDCARAAKDYSGDRVAAGAYFKTNAEFWLNLQNFYDLECERRAGKALEIERQMQPVGAG
jgi:hypothetical protein